MFFLLPCKLIGNLLSVQYKLKGNVSNFFFLIIPYYYNLPYGRIFQELLERGRFAWPGFLSCSLHTKKHKLD